MQFWVTEALRDSFSGCRLSEELSPTLSPKIEDAAYLMPTLDEDDNDNAFQRHNMPPQLPGEYQSCPAFSNIFLSTTSRSSLSGNPNSSLDNNAAFLKSSP